MNIAEMLAKRGGRRRATTGENDAMTQLKEELGGACKSIQEAISATDTDTAEVLGLSAAAYQRVRNSTASDAEAKKAAEGVVGVQKALSKLSASKAFEVSYGDEEEIFDDDFDDERDLLGVQNRKVLGRDSGGRKSGRSDSSQSWSGDRDADGIQTNKVSEEGTNVSS